MKYIKSSTGEAGNETDKKRNRASPPRYQRDAFLTPVAAAAAVDNATADDASDGAAAVITTSFAYAWRHLDAHNARTERQATLRALHRHFQPIPRKPSGLSLAT